VHRAACFVLTGGDIAFGLLASARPSWLSGIIQEDESEVRRIGARDLASGLALWGARDKRWALLMSVRTTLFEGIGWLRTKPRLAIVPLIWTGLAVLALLTKLRKPHRDEASAPVRYAWS
jgi:hypothetical protein